MAKFIANLLPYFAFLWSLNLLLTYRKMYDEFEVESQRLRMICPIVIISVTSFFIVLPIRTIINKSLSNDLDNEEDNQKYDEWRLKFPTDYDRENPVTKNEAFINLLELRIKTEQNNEAQQ